MVITPVECGMAELWALLPAADAAAIKTALDAVASETIHGKGVDRRSADQRRADALAELASAALTDPHLTKAHGHRPAVQVTVAATALMGLDDQPAELDGYGPITAAMARRIAHRYKHSGHWTVHRDDHTGITTWTDRKRRQYRTRPPSQPTTTTADQRPGPVAATVEAATTRRRAGDCVPPATGDPNLEPPPF